jgi:hypothetical protein
MTRTFRRESFKLYTIVRLCEGKTVYGITIITQEKARNIIVLLLTIEHSNSQLQSVAWHTSCFSGFLLFLQ